MCSLRKKGELQNLGMTIKLVEEKGLIEAMITLVLGIGERRTSPTFKSFPRMADPLWRRMEVFGVMYL